METANPGRRSVRMLAASWTLLATLGACTAKPSTAIIIEVDSDLAVPNEIDRIAFRVTDGAKTAVDQVQELGVGAGRIGLPARLAVVGSGGDAVNVEVVGRRGSKDVLTRSAVLRFVSGKTMAWRGYLDRPCLGVACSDGQSCEAGPGCIPLDRVDLQEHSATAGPGRGVWTLRAADGPLAGQVPFSATYAGYDETSRHVVAVVSFGQFLQSDQRQVLLEWRSEAGAWAEIWRSKGQTNEVLPSGPIVFDEAGGTLISVTGGGIIQWDPGERAWRRLRGAGLTAPLRAVYDRSRGVVVAIDFLNVVEWDGRTGALTKHPQIPASPAAKPLIDDLDCSTPDASFPALGYDERLGRVIAWSSRLDAWGWDASAGRWTPIGVDHQGGPKDANGVAYDPAIGRWVFFGGVRSKSTSGGPVSPVTTTAYWDDTWAWDGVANTWSYQTAPRKPRPSPREGAAMVFDRARGRVVLFGGHTGSVGDGTYHPIADTWEWSGGAESAPSATTPGQSDAGPGPWIDPPDSESADPGAPSTPPGRGTPPPDSTPAPATSMPTRQVSLDRAELATRLARLMWAGRADEALIQRTATVQTTDQVHGIAASMAESPRFADGVRALFDRFLGLDAVVTTTGDLAAYPFVTRRMRQSMMAENRAVRRRLGERRTRVARHAADGVVLIRRSAARAALWPGWRHEQRAGQHAARREPARGRAHAAEPAFRAAHAAQRGEFVRRALLCQPVPPEPKDVVRPAPPSTENGVPVDTYGQVTNTPSGAPIYSNGFRQLLEALGRSCDVRVRLARRWVEYATGNAIANSVDEAAVREVAAVFAGSRNNLRQLIIAITQSPPFLAP